VVDYHGLAHLYLPPFRLLMRPQLNGGTLGRLKRVTMGEADATLRNIRNRWAGANPVLTWHQISRPRRERVLAELEETSRQLGEADREFAADLAVALDVLDGQDSAPLLELLKQAQSDIVNLLDQLAASQPTR
jgi:hypothetical protein